MAMPANLKNKLTTYRVFLLKDMYISEEFLAFLTSDFTLTDSMKDEIMTGKTNEERIGKFLDNLVRRGSKAFSSFLMALVETHQDHIAQRLDQTEAARLIHQRNTKYEGSTKEEPGPGKTGCGNGNGVPTGPTVVAPVVPVPVSLTKDSTPDPPLTEDLSIAVVELTSRPEFIELTLQVSDHNVVHPREGVHCVKNGLAILIRHECIPSPDYRDLEEINTAVTSYILNQLFECLNFTVDNECECSAEVIRNASWYKKLESFDAFLLFFVGFGRTDGTVYGKDGQERSIVRDILPLFNAEACPALRNKPKLFVFQLAQPAKPTGVVGDHVDANLNRLPNDDIWADMTIFSAVTNISSAMCEKYKSEKKQPSYNIMYRVLMEVLNRFCHQMSFQEMLSKVQVILTSQAMREKYEEATHTCSFFSTPNTKPVYLKPKC